MDAPAASRRCRAAGGIAPPVRAHAAASSPTTAAAPAGTHASVQAGWRSGWRHAACRSEPGRRRGCRSTLGRGGVLRAGQHPFGAGARRALEVADDAPEFTPGDSRAPGHDSPEGRSAAPSGSPRRVNAPATRAACDRPYPGPHGSSAGWSGKAGAARVAGTAAVTAGRSAWRIGVGIARRAVRGDSCRRARAGR